MSNLSHTTKVAIRQAITALKNIDNQRYNKRELLPDQHQVVSQHIAEKAGFTSRAALEAFARKYHLL